MLGPQLVNFGLSALSRAWPESGIALFFGFRSVFLVHSGPVPAFGGSAVARAWWAVPVIFRDLPRRVPSVSGIGPNRFRPFPSIPVRFCDLPQSPLPCWPVGFRGTNQVESLDGMERENGPRLPLPLCPTPNPNPGNGIQGAIGLVLA